MSGNDNNGTIIGNVSLIEDRFGNSNSAYYFPGEQGSYIDVDHNSSFSGITDGFTLSVWTTYQNHSSNSRLIEIGNPDGNSKGITVNVNSDSKNWSGYIWTGPNGGIGIPNPNQVVEEDVWIHLILTFDFITGDSKIYIDGTLVGEKSVENYVNYFNTYDLSDRTFNIGRKTETAFDPWKGKIDDIAIWNRVLTEVEITTISDPTFELNP